MIRSPLYTFRLVIVMAFCITILSSCAWEKEYGLTIEAQYFRFQRDEQTTEKMLASFVPAKEGKAVLLQDPDTSPVRWEQQQFLNLAVALLAKNAQSDSKLTSLTFAVSCKQVDWGPQSLEMVFDRIDDYQGKRARIQTQLLVDAQAGYVEMPITVYYPSDKTVARVGDLSSKINAETILALSEKMGGEEIRNLMRNECVVQGSLLDNEWSIRYRPSSRQDQEQALFFNATTGILLKTK